MSIGYPVFFDVEMDRGDIELPVRIQVAHVATVMPADGGGAELCLAAPLEGQWCVAVLQSKAECEARMDAAVASVMAAEGRSQGGGGRGRGD